ncbi:MAG: DUF4136 domain-containing protein [bacterium]
MSQRHVCRRLVLGFSLLGFLAGAGCASGPSVRTSYDQGVDFTRFRTFGFFQPLGTDRAGYRSLVSQQLMSATQRELQARGLQRADSDPDLLVNFNANLDQRLRITQTPARPIGGFYGHRRGFYSTWPMYQETQIRQYTQGTLVVDVVDAARRQLVWEGVAVRRVTERTEQNLGPVLDQVVAEMFEQFPLRPATSDID